MTKVPDLELSFEHEKSISDASFFFVQLYAVKFQRVNTLTVVFFLGIPVSVVVHSYNFFPLSDFR